jgi:hypothetical protein
LMGVVLFFLFLDRCRRFPLGLGGGQLVVLSLPGEEGQGCC